MEVIQWNINIITGNILKTEVKILKFSSQGVAVTLLLQGVAGDPSPVGSLPRYRYFDK